MAAKKQQTKKPAQRAPEEVSTPKASEEKRVRLRFQAECSDSNVAVFGENGVWGRITGKTGEVSVPKEDWSRFYTGQVQRMLKQRVLIVLSGLSQEERELYGVDYKEGELLDRKAFMKLLDMGEALLDIFPALCEEHKKMVLQRFLEASEQGDKRAYDRSLVLQLNEMTKTGQNRRGMFWKVIENMNKKDAEG